MNMLISNANLIVNTDIETNEGDELEFAVVFNIDDERMFYLNSTSYEILKIAEKPISVQEIIDYFNDMYVLTIEDIDSINRVILDMIEKNILLQVIKE